jgi:hypothetical protein
LSATGPPAWYRERHEPEETFVGIVRERETGASPMGRTRLLFELERGDGTILPIYGPHLEAALTPLVGRTAHIRGRVVDLASEGLGLELWAASVDGLADRGTIRHVALTSPVRQPCGS